MQRYLWRCALAVALGLAFGAWLFGCGDHGTPTQPTPTDAAPAAVSPAAALRRMEWLFDNRSVDAYRTLLTDDFRFYCSPTDSAGSPWRGTPWTRADELLFATHFLVGGGSEPPATSVQLTLDKNLFVYTDPEFPWDAAGRWHKNIRSTLLLRVGQDNGGTFELQGHANFCLVRGDSAAIPEELLLHGVGRDSTRWYLRRWDDETAQGGGSLRAVQGSYTTICAIKSLYH